MPLRSKLPPLKEENAMQVQDSLENVNSDTAAVLMEGTLRVKSNGTFPTFLWKYRHILLSQKGSLTVQKFRHNKNNNNNSQRHNDDTATTAKIIHEYKDWIAYDMEEDTFCIKVYDNNDTNDTSPSTTSDSMASSTAGNSHHDNSTCTASASSTTGSNNEVMSSDSDNADTDDDDDDDQDHPPSDLHYDYQPPTDDSLLESNKPHRVYYCHCTKEGSKTLWLQAFDRLGRLSKHRLRKKTLLDYFFSAASVRQRSLLEKEYKVQPTYAYPRQYMTRQELTNEMMLPSETFYNLRAPNNNSACDTPEIGNLRVEVLACLGLPKLERTSETDAVVYCVCGRYAFATDVISNQNSPMWLRKSRRACEIPLFEAYARLYVGVFDYDGNRTKDEFAGRVVVDLARLRPNSAYDVTLPLRLSSHVYSKRQRGAIRLRLTLTYTSERRALLSYVPKQWSIPLPQHTRPKTSVAVMCADPKSFRNLAITVHGAHLPGKFTFQQMRAAIREINFTRKWILTNIRLGFRETRQWVHPFWSASLLCAWMHCVYANTFALVPAYLVLFFLLVLMQNYAKYGIDGPLQRGFIPPSWEELLVALLRGGDPSYNAIEPLELGLNNSAIAAPDEATDHSHDLDLIDVKAKTHAPRGKFLFRAFGFLHDAEHEFSLADDEHLEFPFADGVNYPKFSITESLVRGNTPKAVELGSNSTSDLRLAANGKGDIRLIPRIRLDRDLALMRKDSSGLNDFDEEETRFNPTRAVVATGRKAVSDIKKTTKRTAITTTKGVKRTAITSAKYSMGAANMTVGAAMGAANMTVGAAISAAKTVANTATDVTEMAGLGFVVSGVHGIGTGLNTGAGHVVSGASNVVRPLTRSTRDFLRRSSAKSISSLRLSNRRSLSVQIPPPSDEMLANIAKVAHEAAEVANRRQEHASAESPMALFSDTGIGTPSLLFKRVQARPLGNDPNELDQASYPEQNVDVEVGSSSGRKVTDDLLESKEKMHELTWHLFNDKVHTIPFSDSVYFGQAKISAKRRKNDIAKEVEKLMKTGPYSHSNPFVARMGQYVEPLIGSAYSFLCVFRAGFNVMTWRDPMLTFWVSVFGSIFCFILFIFPWRIFLFFVGAFLIGPQNWVFRKLRESGKLPPLRHKIRVDDSEEKTEAKMPETQPVFYFRKHGNDYTSKPPKIDPKEIQNVVVPYSPLIYNRFYDWPPEPQYAQVKPSCDGAGTKRHKKLC
jgi:hypothetical protein